MATRSDREKSLIDGYIRDINNIPKEINDLIFAFFFLIIGSDMLTDEEEEQLMEWIDDSRKCDFKLLFKATRDGFGVEEFHKKCDGKGANISIIKSDNECIFGGCSSESWHNKNDWIADDFAWLYSLRNNKGIQKKFKIIKNKSWAMMGWGNCGPTYGKFDDLVISNNCNENQDSYTELGFSYEGGSDPYQLNDGNCEFRVLDYEMWQIVRN